MLLLFLQNETLSEPRTHAELLSVVS